MKKTLLLVALMGFITANAQLEISPNPFDINSGTISITYGALGDYSIYNPNFDSNLYIYSGLETDGNADTWDYTDTWNNTATLTPLTWNVDVNAYVATINLRNRTYDNESNPEATLPDGAQVNNWYFIIRNGAGNAQSATQQGSNYGLQPATVLSVSGVTKPLEFAISNGKVSTSILGKSSLEIFSIDGKKLKSISFENKGGNFELPLQLESKGVMIAVLQNDGKSKTLKFIN